MALAWILRSWPRKLRASSIRRFSRLPVACLFLLLACCAGNGIGSSAASAQTERLEITGSTMGPIRYTVVVAHHPDSITPQQLQQKVDSTLERVNQLMSTYLPDSDISRFNVSKSTEFVAVDPETAEVVGRALQISEQTKGAFDISVGPAVNLWKFGPDKAELESLPSDSQLKQVAKIIGYQKLEVRVQPPALRKTEPGLRIDLSAIAKGYAVDMVAKALDESGCKQFMVEVGGEVFVRGQRAGGGPWQIGVEEPDTRQTANRSPASREVFRVASISNNALATSGDYRNYFEFDGKRFSHTIDPQTCRPVEHGLASACVIADDCMTADAIATAVMVLGPDEGQKFCQEAGVEYLFITRDSDFGSELKELSSQGFPIAEINSPQVDSSKPEKSKARSAQGILPTFIGAAVIIGLAILGMAVGSIFANKPVQGSCGGLSSATGEDGEESCTICSKPTTDCVENAGA